MKSTTRRGFLKHGGMTIAAAAVAPMTAVASKKKASLLVDWQQDFLPPEDWLVEKSWRELINVVPNAQYLQIDPGHPFNMEGVTNCMGREQSLCGGYLWSKDKAHSSGIFIRREIWLHCSGPKPRYTTENRVFPVFTVCGHEGWSETKGSGKNGECRTWKEVRDLCKQSIRMKLRKGYRPIGYENYRIETTL